MSTFRLYAGRALPWVSALLLASVWLFLPWVQRADLGLLDAHFRLSRLAGPRPAAGPEVVIVGIDEASLATIPEPMALYHRPLGLFLEAMAQARPLAVGVDFALPERSMEAVLPGADAQLLRGILALKGKAPLVLGRMLGVGGQPRPIHPPFVSLAGEGGLGYLLAPLDADQVARRSLSFLGEGGEGPSFSARLAEACGRSSDAMLVDFTLGPSFAQVPLNQVLRWQAEGRTDLLRARFQGRVVLLGTVLPYEDRVNLPVRLASWEPPTLAGSPGVLLHAQTLRSLLAGSGIQPLPTWAVFLLGLAGALGGLSLGRHRRGGMVLLGALAVAEAAAFGFLRQGVFLPLIACGGPAAGAWLLARGQGRLQDRRARRKAESAARAQAEFLARMSHEIRTPMNAILGLAHLAQRQETSPVVADYLRKIAGASRALTGILNDVLDFSKIQAGRLELEAVPFEMVEVLARLDDLFGSQARVQGLQWRLALGEGVPAVLVGDPMRLGQILANLVGNALKFTSTGQVRVAVTALESGPGQAALRFAVEDTGIGLSKAALERLFQAFGQADASISRRYGGTGLGLAISRRLVAAMGGDLVVGSAPGQGSTFSFEVAFPLGVLAASRPVLAASGLQGLRVLLVEDDPINQQVAREVLLGAGAEVAVASTGLEGVCLAQEGDPQLVLMDLRLPDLDGLEAARRIWKSRPGLPIVALTADATPEVLDTCRRAGMGGVLLKPFEPDDLVRLLGAWVEPGPAVPRPALAPAELAGAWVPKAQADDPAELPGLSVQAALRRLGGNRMLLGQLMVLFRNRYALEAKVIGESLEAGDREGATRRLHTLKGAAASLSATALVKACQNLQLCLRLEDGSTLRGCLEALARDLAQVLASCLEGQASLGPAQAPLSATGGDPAVHRKELGEQLRMRSPDAEFAAAELRVSLEGTPHHARVVEIERLIQGFEFKDALRELELLPPAGECAASGPRTAG